MGRILFTTGDLNKHTYDACQKTLKKAKAKHHKELLQLKRDILGGIVELNLNSPFINKIEIEAMIENKFKELLE